jgi:hypothetical protein
MQLSHGKMSNKRPDQHGRFSLTDERRRRSDDSFGTRYAHGPEEEDGEFSDEPLENTPVVQELNERDEEDDGWNDTSKEPAELGDGRIGQKGHTIVRESKEKTGELGDEVEDVVSSSGAQDEQRNDELKKHTNDDGVPVDLGSVARSGPETEDEDSKTKERDRTVGAGVVLALLTGKGTDDNHSNGQSSTCRHAHLLWDETCESNTSVVPYPVHGLGDDGDGDVESDQSDHDGQPEQEWNDPVLVVTVNDDTCDPPSGSLSDQSSHKTLRATYPVNKHPMKI